MFTRVGGGGGRLQGGDWLIIFGGYCKRESSPPDFRSPEISITNKKSVHSACPSPLQILSFSSDLPPSLLKCSVYELFDEATCG